jgi:4'-phosphopantetheinyl transferase
VAGGFRGEVSASAWQLELASLAEAGDLEASLSAEEARQAEGMAHPLLRARFVVSRGLRRKVLAGILACEGKELVFVEGEGAKPRLREASGWDFNLSHAGDHVALVVGRGQVGVDLEMLRPVREMAALVGRYFHPDEAAAWRVAPEAGRERAFFVLWSAREAAMKCLGLGLAAGLAKTRVDACILGTGKARAEVAGRQVGLRQLEAPQGYVLVTAESVS